MHVWVMTPIWGWPAQVWPSMRHGQHAGKLAVAAVRRGPELAELVSGAIRGLEAEEMVGRAANSKHGEPGGVAVSAVMPEAMERAPSG